MKKLLRTLLCAGILVTVLSVSAFAAGREAPELQGDFYVLVNGQYVTFADAVPQLKDGRSYLPFVAVFDQLGFSEENMTWDAASATVTAEKEGVSISLTEGSTTITVTQPDDTTAVTISNIPHTAILNVIRYTLTAQSKKSNHSRNAEYKQHYKYVCYNLSDCAKRTVAFTHCHLPP